MNTMSMTRVANVLFTSDGGSGHAAADFETRTDGVATYAVALLPI